MTVLEQLKELDLSEYPISDLDNLLIKLGGLAIMLTDYHDKAEYPKLIERAVNNSKGNSDYNTVSRISYKPAEFNKSYLRASTPKNTMFYGSVISDDLEGEEKKYARIVGASEVSSLMRNSDVVEGWSQMTFGKWQVVENISLATIIDPTKKYEQPYLNELAAKYLTFLEEVPPHIKENTLRCLAFLSEEFSKYVTSGNNHEYLISSKFTEIFTNTSNYDGIIYPSVQAKGYGLCVAIHPRAMNKLKLIRVLKCKITKTLGEDGENHFRLDNEKNCLVEDGCEKFELKDIRK
jgi:hypothetical protein